MTAEERAKSLANRLDGAKPKEWNALIASAIREAEDGKLEAVAGALDRSALRISKLEGHDIFPIGEMLERTAAEIRTLKSTKD